MPEQTSGTTEKVLTISPANVDMGYKMLQDKILDLEKQLSTTTAETQVPKVDVSVADMNQMYSNHLKTLDFMFMFVVSIFVFTGFLLTWIGFKTFRTLIERIIIDVTKPLTKDAIKESQEKIEEESQKAIEKAIEPLEEKYNEVTERQNEEYNRIINRQNEQDRKIKAGNSLRQGNQHYQDKEYEKAIKNYSEVIEIDSNNEEAHYSRALAYYELKRYQESLKDYTKSIHTNPYNGYYYCNRAIVYTRLDRYEEALKDYAEAIQIDPNYGDYYFNRAIVYTKLDKYEEAIKDYTKAIQINPNESRYYCNRGIANTYLNQYEEALEDYNLAEKIDPHTLNIKYNKAWTYALMKKPEREILTLLEKAILENEGCIEIARNTDDFISLRENQEFRKLVGLDDKK